MIDNYINQVMISNLLIESSDPVSFTHEYESTTSITVEIDNRGAGFIDLIDNSLPAKVIIFVSLPREG